MTSVIPRSGRRGPRFRRGGRIHAAGRRLALLAARLDTEGLDGTALLESADEPKYGELLEKNTGLAAARGVFGAPTFVVGDDHFFGNDRLTFLEARLLG